MKKISEENMIYFCNGAGDAFYWDANGNQDAKFDPATRDLIDEHIPAVLRNAYNKAWTEDYGYPCYIMEIQSKHYLALIAEFGDTAINANGDYFRGEELKNSIIKAAAELEKNLAASNEDGVELFFPEDSNTPFCQWELVVAVPADGVTMERMTRIAAIMDESFKDVNYILASRIVWDTDDEDDEDDNTQAEDLGLPECVNVPVSELLEEEENEADLDREELLDRITDWLSDRYGFCVYSFDAE